MGSREIGPYQKQRGLSSRSKPFSLSAKQKLTWVLFETQSKNTTAMTVSLRFGCVSGSKVFALKLKLRQASRCHDPRRRNQRQVRSWPPNLKKSWSSPEG